MEHTYGVAEGQDAAFRLGKRRVSWGALFAGLIIALVVHLMLGMLGAGIGLSTIDPAQVGETPQASSLGIGAGIWWVVSSTIAVFAGAWVAGRLCGFRKTTEGALHGVLVWGLSTLITFYLLSAAVSGLASTAANAVGTAVSATAQGAAAVAPAIGQQVSEATEGEGGNIVATVQQELKQLLAQSGKPELQPEALEQRAEGAVDEAQQEVEQAAEAPVTSDNQLSAAMDALLREGKDVAAEVDREAAANMLASRTDMSPQEARQTVDQWIQTAQQAREEARQKVEEMQQQAREAADRAAEASARIALWSFVAFLVGAIAAAFGGVIGARSVPVEPDLVRRDTVVR